MDSLYLRFDETLTGKLVECQKCGKCCNGTTYTKTALSDSDIERLEKGLGKPLNKIFESNEIMSIENGDTPIMAMTQPCKFQKDNQCTIYEFRPLTCRQYPLFLGEGTIQIDSVNCPSGKKLYEENREKYTIKIVSNTSDMNVIDTQTKGEDVDWSKLFLFNDKLYNYYAAAYNNTILNEREIEIPIIVDYLRHSPAQTILEIGNVLSHYFKNVSHEIVDKDEKAEKVINEDIVTFNPNRKYDLIISISTMEHVGFEGDGVYKLTKGYVKKGFDNVKKLLSSTGKFVFTIPLGFNPELDWMLKTDQLKCDEIYCLERNIENYEWAQVEYGSIKKLPWNNFVQNAFNTYGDMYALRRVRYLLVGVINGCLE